MALPSDLSKLLGSGENPNGTISQTPDGTIRNGLDSDDGGWGRFNRMADGERWNADPMPRLDPPGMFFVTATPKKARKRR